MNEIDVYTQATQLAITLGQVLKDGTNEYYLTLRQLEVILQRRGAALSVGAPQPAYDIDQEFAAFKTFAAAQHLMMNLDEEGEEFESSQTQLARDAYQDAWQKALTASVGAPVASEDLVIEIARELYDRFVMGGWEPQDAYPQIREWLMASPPVSETGEKAKP